MTLLNQPKVVFQSSFPLPRAARIFFKDGPARARCSGYCATQNTFLRMSSLVLTHRGGARLCQKNQLKTDEKKALMKMIFYKSLRCDKSVLSI